MTYAVNEVFDTLQGEGVHTGRPSTFLRLQGCPVGCAWCDTKYTWSRGQPATWEYVVAKSGDKPDERCAQLESRELVRYMVEREPRHVVITGGEPAMYDLLPLTAELLAVGKSCQVETSGTHALSVHDEAWITCSPKINMPGGFAVRTDVLQRANEIKMPVGKPRDVDLLREHVLPHIRPGVLIYLQPLSCSSKATAVCIDQATRNGWMVSVQTHRFIGLR
jgi:7-carboxy-7-deazaguanine synthase